MGLFQNAVHKKDTIMKTETSPLLYGSKPMKPEPINITLEKLAQRLNQRETMIAELEPGDGTYYNLLLVPAVSLGTREYLGRFGISDSRAHCYLIVTKLTSYGGETFYSYSEGTIPCDMESVKNEWTRVLLAWWCNLLWEAMEDTPLG